MAPSSPNMVTKAIRSSGRCPIRASTRRTWRRRSISTSPDPMIDTSAVPVARARTLPDPAIETSAAATSSAGGVDIARSGDADVERLGLAGGADVARSGDAESRPCRPRPRRGRGRPIRRLRPRNRRRRGRRRSRPTRRSSAPRSAAALTVIIDLAVAAPVPADAVLLLRADLELAIFDHDLGLGEDRLAAAGGDAGLAAGLDADFIRPGDRDPVEGADLVVAVDRGSGVARLGCPSATSCSRWRARRSRRWRAGDCTS